jgi:hypothetical protein
LKNPYSKEADRTRSQAYLLNVENFVIAGDSYAGFFDPSRLLKNPSG